MAAPQPPSITEGELVKFLAAKGATNTCWSCGVNDWGMISPMSDGSRLVTPVLGAAGAMLNQSGPLAVLACQNCGYLRMHSLIHVAEWVRENRAQRDGQSN